MYVSYLTPKYRTSKMSQNLLIYVACMYIYTRIFVHLKAIYNELM